MFCANCGYKIEEKSKFCHHCGTGTNIDFINPKKTNKTEQISKNNVNVDNINEVVREYQARTNIKSKEEAKKYLKQLKNLLWMFFLNFILMIFFGESESGVAAIFYITHIGLLVYFVIFSLKLLKAENLSRANALWCVFFAPISWLLLYPLMANPLKIILGEKLPPTQLNNIRK